MPFKSKSQQRLFFAKEHQGKLPQGTAERWAHHTKDLKALPEHVKKTASQIADEILEKMAKLPPMTGKALSLHSEVNKLTASKAMDRIHGDRLSAQAMAEKTKGIADQAQKARVSRVQGTAAKARDAAGVPGNVRVASVDPVALEVAAPGVSQKFWQGLTGLSDDVLMAGMRLKEKSDKARQKHAAQQVASSLSMLLKMSDVSKKEVEHFFQENPNPEDEQVHAWADKKKENKHEVEDKAYELATETAKKDSKGDKLEGGKADGKSPGDFDATQMAMGKKVEREHTNDPALAEEISSDHLSELPDYYSRLKKMEDAAPKQAMQQEQPLQASFPNLLATNALPAQPQQLPPDIFQLLKAQALIDQQKLAQAGEEKTALSLSFLDRAVGNAADRVALRTLPVPGTESFKDFSHGLRFLKQEHPLTYRYRNLGTVEGSYLPSSITQEFLDDPHSTSNLRKLWAAEKMGTYDCADPQKLAQPTDPGDGPHLPYQPEEENRGQIPMNVPDEQQLLQDHYMQMAAERARSQQIENEYTGKVRRGELVGSVGGMLGGGLLGHALSAGSKGHLPATALGVLGGGLLGKGFGRHVGQQQGLDYLQQYSGVPWAVQ